MTQEDFNHIKWKPICHWSYDDHYSSTYYAELPTMDMQMCINTPKPSRRGRQTAHYLFNGKVYKSRESILRAINDHENSVQ